MLNGGRSGARSGDHTQTRDRSHTRPHRSSGWGENPLDLDPRPGWGGDRRWRPGGLSGHVMRNSAVGNSPHGRRD